MMYVPMSDKRSHPAPTPGLGGCRSVDALLESGALGNCAGPTSMPFSIVGAHTPLPRFHLLCRLGLSSLFSPARSIHRGRDHNSKTARDRSGKARWTRCTIMSIHVDRYNA